MEKILSFEINNEGEFIEIHVNKLGAEFLINALTRLTQERKNNDLHFMIPDWGGEELTQAQSLDDNTKQLPHVKIMYWGDE